MESENDKPQSWSWQRIMVGAPLTFAIAFTFEMAWGWSASPFWVNFAKSVAEAIAFTVGYAVMDKLLVFPNLK